MRCFIIGGGSSLEGFDFSRLSQEITIGVNFTFKFTKTTHLIWSDIDLYPQNKETIDAMNGITKWVDDRIAPDHFYAGINRFKNVDTFYGEEGFQNGLYGGVNGCYLTGILGISLAVALKYKPIYLLGYDCTRINGKLHWHEFSRDDDVFSRWLHLYDPFKGQEIYNCSMVSLLTQFPKISIDEVLNDRDKSSDKATARETVQVSCVDTVLSA